MKEQLEKHFAESANLLKTLAGDYQKLYQHLAQSSTNLLPELANKPIFPSLEQKPAESAAVATEDHQPLDYSEGSSGILKAEK